jgi:starch synthase (maltosyl-transferring)
VTPPLIYNLFPRLVGPTTRWSDHVARAKEMEFNWIYLNPWHYPGFSGSLYAPKDFNRLNPLFLPAGADPLSLDPLRRFLDEARKLDLRVMMDLVINHTSRDSALVAEHPDWYEREPNGEPKRPFAIDPDDPGKRTVWGDLAEIDNAGSPDRANLWRFWGDLVEQGLELGFSGFRCDAAYMVPPELWRYLIDRSHKDHPDTVFFAETLGGPLDSIPRLRYAGFDYYFNSSKWWNFRDSWALEQNERFAGSSPSISFPETHDTSRLAGDTGGSEPIQKQRYAVAAAFSAGVMMPLGYEFGFRKKPDVVTTMPSDWERKSFDLRKFITRVNRLKRRCTALHGEGRLSAPRGLNGDVVVLERQTGERDRAYILVNTDPNVARDIDLTNTLDHSGRLAIYRICRDQAPARGEPVPREVSLGPAETAYLLPR